MFKLSALWAPRAALALTALLLLSLSAVAGLFVWLAYKDEIRAAEVRAETSAHVVAAHMRWIGEAAFQALRRVDAALGPDLRAITDDVGDNLDTSQFTLPESIPVQLLDAEGRFIRTRGANDPSSITVADRPYFQALRDGQDWYVSPMVTGRATGRKLFVIGHRIEREGRFLGAVMVAIPDSLLFQFWTSLDLGPQSAIGLIREDGWLVARHPAPEATINLSNYILFTRYLPSAPSGTYQYSDSPADGFSRIVGYYTVDGLPLIAVAGISRDAVIARFWSGLQPVGLVAVPVALALLAMVASVTMLMRRYERQREALSQALDQNRMLFQEVHHRVKNNLTTVLSLLQLHPMPANSKRELGTRIRAMAALHEQIYLSDQFGTIDLSGYVRRMVENLRQTAPNGVQITCQLADVEVDADMALPLGLIVNEVATNAFKHAFPEGRTGVVSIFLERLEDDRGRLRVRDNGIGFEGEWRSTGMGSRLITGLCKQISADCMFVHDDGTVFTVDFPLSPAPDDEAPRLTTTDATMQPEAAG